MVDANTHESGLSQPWSPPPPLLITIAAIGLIELLSRTIVSVPTPGTLLLVTVAYAAGVGGLRVSLISTALVSAYILYFEGRRPESAGGRLRRLPPFDKRFPSLSRGTTSLKPPFFPRAVKHQRTLSKPINTHTLLDLLAGYLNRQREANL